MDSPFTLLDMKNLGFAFTWTLTWTCCYAMRHEELGLGVPLVRCLRLARLRRTIRHLCSCFILFIAAMALYQRCQRLLASIPFIQLVSRLYSTSTYTLLSVSQGCCKALAAVCLSEGLSTSSFLMKSFPASDT